MWWPQALGLAMQVAGSYFRGQNPTSAVLDNVAGRPADNFQSQALGAMAREAWAHFPIESVARIGSREFAVHTLAKMSLHDFLGLGLSKHGKSFQSHPIILS